MERTFDCRPLFGRHIKRAAYKRRIGDHLESLAKSLLRLAAHRQQSGDKDLAYALVEVRGGKILQRHSRDGKNFLLSLAGDCLIEIESFAPQLLPVALHSCASAAFRASLEEAKSLHFHFFDRRLHAVAALLIEQLVLVPELLARSFRLSLFCVGVGEFGSDALFTRIDRVEDRAIEKALQQPYQDEKVERLRTDSEPIDEARATVPQSER